MGYQLIVLSDCCTDADDEVHRALLTKVYPRQAEVLTAGEWLARLQDIEGMPELARGCPDRQVYIWISISVDVCG